MSFRSLFKKTALSTFQSAQEVRKAAVHCAGTPKSTIAKVKWIQRRATGAMRPFYKELKGLIEGSQVR